MNRIFTILFLFTNLYCNAQSANFDYISTYNSSFIKKNQVLSLTKYYCGNCYDDTKIDTIINYKKYFTKNALEAKVINYKPNGKIYLVDSFSYSTDSLTADIYLLRDNKKYIQCKLFDFSLKESILNNKAICKSYKKQKMKRINFSSNLPMKYYEYILTDNGPELYTAFDYDSLGNVTRSIIKTNASKKLDTILYSYDYKQLSGRSIFFYNNIKYLHSTIILNDKFQLVHENIFDVEYNKLDYKLIQKLEPTESTMYYYYDNGLIKLIDFLKINYISKLFFKYEYY